MTRVKKFSVKPHAVRLPNRLDNELAKYLTDNPAITKSDVFQAAVECYLNNKKCLAKRRIE